MSDLQSLCDKSRDQSEQLHGIANWSEFVIELGSEFKYVDFPDVYNPRDQSSGQILGPTHKLPAITLRMGPTVPLCCVYAFISPHVC